MTDKERRKRFQAERREQLRRGVRIQSQTYAEILLYLDQARKRILAALADQPSEFAAWRLESLQGEVRRTLELFERGTIATLSTGLDRSFQAGAELVTEPLKAGGIDVTGILPRLDPRLLIALKSFQTDRIRDISTTTVNRINTEIGQAAIGVQNPFEAAQKVSEHLKSPKARALTIVRTELGTAYSEASQQRKEQAVAAGVTGLQKQWRRSGKLHPRITHDLADGQIVAVDQPFLVGGVKIMKPRDPKLDPKDRINCGCTSIPHMAHWRVSTPGRKPFTAEEIATSPTARQVEEILAATPVLDEVLSRPRLAELRASLAQTPWGQAQKTGQRLYGMSDEQALALHAYTFLREEGGAGRLNRELRAGGPPAGSDLARLLAVQKDALGRLPAVDVELQRRVKTLPPDLVPAAPGDIWTERGYFSTTRDAGPMEPYFASMPHQMLIIRSRSGRDISAFSTFPQGEVIFTPGQSFVIRDRVDVDGASTFWMDEAGGD